MRYQEGYMTPDAAASLVERLMKFMIEDWRLIADLREIKVKPSDQAEMKEALSIVMAHLKRDSKQPHTIT